MSQISAYPVNVRYSDEDQGYLASAPDLPGCIAFGETPEEAEREVRLVIEGWLEIACEEGWPIPTPSSQQDTPLARTV